MMIPPETATAPPLLPGFADAVAAPAPTSLFTTLLAAISVPPAANPVGEEALPDPEPDASDPAPTETVLLPVIATLPQMLDNTAINPPSPLSSGWGWGGADAAQATPNPLSAAEQQTAEPLSPLELDITNPPSELGSETANLPYPLERDRGWAGAEPTHQVSIPNQPAPIPPAPDSAAPIASPLLQSVAAPAPAPPAPPPPPVTQPAPTLEAHVETVRLGITRQLAEGRETITIRLDPPEQGRVDIRLSFAEGGRVEAVIASDNASLLDLMRRDAGELQRSFAEAGLRTDASALKFEAGKFEPSFDRSPQQQQHSGQQPRQQHNQHQHGTLMIALPAERLPPHGRPTDRLNRII